MVRCTFVAAVCLAVLMSSLSVEAASDPAQATKETTRVFLSDLRADAKGIRHGIADFERHLAADDRAALQSRGITVFQSAGGTSYYVRVASATIDTVQAVPAQFLVRAIGVDAKLTEELRTRGLADFRAKRADGETIDYVRNDDGSLNLMVTFFPATARATIDEILARHALRHELLTDTDFLVTIRSGDLRALAGEDSVQWVDAAPPPPVPENDRTRPNLGVDALQQFNATNGTFAGLSGQGVVVAVFDSGVDANHDDFAGRVLVNDHGSSSHGTHVAGTVGGTGVISNGKDSWNVANNGTAYQWRGMAPRVQLIDSGSGAADRGSIHYRYIVTNGMDLSNHSYSFSYDGFYSNSNALRDGLMRGDKTYQGNRIPGRLHVISAGNHGQTAYNGGTQRGYFALTKQVKNAVIVGNFYREYNRLARSSSAGPTHDGRIKPDVVAPGVSIQSTYYCRSCRKSSGTFAVRRDYYRAISGTSMATPAVTGVLSLVLEQYHATFGGAEPLPATLRALIVNGAVDLVGDWPTNYDGKLRAFVGPDFATGFGRVSAPASVAVVSDRRVHESAIETTCKTNTTYFTVNEGASIRLTLAWDDPAGDPTIPKTDPKLVNDLDLVLIDPQGRRHYPWLLDQLAVDNAGNPVPDDQQTCGTRLRIKRTFMPATTGGKEDLTGKLKAAVRGRDHLNNLEQVEISNATGGTWRAEVIGFYVPTGPQPYAIVGAVMRNAP